MSRYVFIILFFMSHAALSAGMSTTRHIFYEWEKSNAIEIVSKDDVETLVQVFVDDGAVTNMQPESIHVSPSMFTLAADARRIVKIYGLSDHLEKDRESMLFVNVTTLPKEVKQGEGAISNRSVINMKYKLFLRPNVMKGMSFENAVNSLKLTQLDKRSAITNNTPFHIVLNSMEFNGTSHEGGIVKPYSTLPLNSLVTGSVKLEYINDSGHKGYVFVGG